MHTQDQYTEAFIKLMPRGRLFDLDPGSNFYDLIFALMVLFEDFDGRIDAFINEMYPDTASEMLPEWLRDYGIPDECTQPDETTAELRLDLLTKYTALGGQSRAYFIALAATLGYTITITEFYPFRTNINYANDILAGEGWQWIWQVNTPVRNNVYFRTNISTASEPLIDFGNERLECVLNKYKPAHTKVIFNYF
jgi:uncharacterized protein YmfQ (DUF2313 family)